MHRKHILLFGIILTFTQAKSQLYNLDTNYVERFRNKIVVVLYNSVQQNSLEVYRSLSKDTAAQSLSYPTLRTSLGLTLSYKFITFSFGTNAFNFLLKGYINEREGRIGKTAIRNYGFVWNPNRFRIELYYRSIQGFHEDKRYEYDPTFTDDMPYQQFPNMQVTSYGADILWCFNGRKRFSIGAPYSYTTRQKKSAGSFMFYFAGNRMSVSAPGEIIPVQVASQYGKYADINRFDGTSLSWGAGYGYTIVIAKIFYINAIIVGRYPFQWKRYETLSGYTKEDFSEPQDPSVVDFAIGRAAVGLNFKRFFVSSYIYADRYDYKMLVKNINDFGIANRNIRGAVMAGIRLNKPKRKKPSSSI